ncbi:HisA/HisF-related TIM barrel protein [Mesonia mobilis]
MKIFPAIDIKDKKCVRLLKGNFENKKVFGPERERLI